MGVVTMGDLPVPSPGGGAPGRRRKKWRKGTGIQVLVSLFFLGMGKCNREMILGLITKQYVKLREYAERRI